MLPSYLVFFLAAGVVGVSCQDGAFGVDGQAYQTPGTFNFDDLPVVEAPKPPFLNLPNSDNSQFHHASPQAAEGDQPYQNFNLVTKVFRLPDGGITTLQVPQFHNS